MIFRRNKKYVALLLGGFPHSAAKAIELVVSPNHRMSFIYGLNVFSIYFNSSLNIKELRKVFMTTMQGEVEMIYIFPNNRTSFAYMAPHVKVKMETAAAERKPVTGDINALKDVITAMSTRFAPPYITAPPVPQQQVQPEQVAEEEPLNDQQIMDRLLTKIHKDGYKSLTPAELDFIKTYKTKYGNPKTDDSNVD